MTSTSMLNASSVPLTRRLAAAQRMNAQLKESNMALAKTLNATLLENRRLSEELNLARGETNEVRMELAEQKQLDDGDAWDDATVDAECQRRLVAYLEQVKASMTKVLDDTFLLTEDVTKTMQLVSAPARRSRSTNSSTAAAVARKSSSSASVAAGAPAPVSHPIRRAPCAASRKPSPAAVAHVSPRVGGHAIHKPQIEIQRLGMDEINRYQEEQRQRREQEEEEAAAAAAAEEQAEEEEEPLAPRNNESEDVFDEEQGAPDAVGGEPPPVEHRASRSSRYSRYRMSIIGEESSEQTEEEERDDDEVDSTPPPPPSARRRRRRRRSIISSSPFQDLGSPQVEIQRLGMDEINRYQEEQRQRRETVLLVPRLVLERVTTTESPRARESNEEFFRRLSNMDAMEGPSWLFSEAGRQSSEPRQSSGAASSRQSREQRQPSELGPSAAAAAGGGRRTSDLGESDAGSGRKRSSRAAAASASYKEPSLNKKMRQGDPNSESVYKDYIPKTKAKKKSSGGGSGKNTKNPPKKKK